MSNQNAFFAERDAQISQGYTWKKLVRCRPVKKDALSIPIIGIGGHELVCFKLVPPQNGTASSVTAMIPAAPAPATTTDEGSGTSGVIWNFLNP